jgi:hypothetical protein
MKELDDFVPGLRASRMAAPSRPADTFLPTGADSGSNELYRNELAVTTWYPFSRSEVQKGFHPASSPPAGSAQLVADGMGPMEPRSAATEFDLSYYI